MKRLMFGCLALVMVPGAVSAQAQPAAGACDRACLVGFIDQYLDALVAQDPTRLPVAPNVKFTENGQRLTLGDGFWNSVTGKGTYRVDVADPAAGQVGTFVTMVSSPVTASGISQPAVSRQASSPRRAAPGRSASCRGR